MYLVSLTALVISSPPRFVDLSHRPNEKERRPAAPLQRPRPRGTTKQRPADAPSRGGRAKHCFCGSRAERRLKLVVSLKADLTLSRRSSCLHCQSTGLWSFLVRFSLAPSCAGRIPSVFPIIKYDNRGARGLQSPRNPEFAAGIAGSASAGNLLDGFCQGERAVADMCRRKSRRSNADAPAGRLSGCCPAEPPSPRQPEDLTTRRLTALIMGWGAFDEGEDEASNLRFDGRRALAEKS